MNRDHLRWPPRENGCFADADARRHGEKNRHQETDVKRRRREAAAAVDDGVGEGADRTTSKRPP